ncbi:MAG: HemK/PrmC family methyltransferase [Bacteroidales bacterium]|nr:HemK/PrmC family methyltransferase [Bacteroidales bacterium]
MNKEELYHKLKTLLTGKLILLSDKPEETIDSTLMALWHAASDSPKSVEEAVKLSLPELTQDEIDNLEELIKQRLNDIPLAHITGRQSFMGIELLTDRRALIPRKETEILGRKALELSMNIAREKNKVKVIDVCCGAGNLGLAIAHFNINAIVAASDLSQEAVDLTHDNISFLKLGERIKATQGDLFSAFETDDYFGKTDLIICNPPYISSAKVPKMISEISENEPVLAFDGGMLGTKIILRLIGEAPKFLTSGGWVVFEIGLGQGPFIKQLCERSEFYDMVETVLDDSGNVRVIQARKL